MAGLDESAQQRIAVAIAQMFDEPIEIASDVASFLDGYLRRVPPRAALGLRAMIWAITWLPLLFVGVPATVDRLTPETRARYLDAWSGSGVYYLREGFYLLKAIALMGWGANPTVRARLDVGPLAHPLVASPVPAGAKT
ncbi:MAG: hypothetical protein ACRENE_25220 [Polyangiaceae bacterium]